MRSSLLRTATRPATLFLHPLPQRSLLNLRPVLPPTPNMTHLAFANDFIDFLNEAITPFHAVEASKRRLKAAGFVQISERDAWDIKRGGKYFFARNDTTVIGFSVGKQFPETGGSFTVLAAHTDSPCLRIKPVACFQKGAALMINTQPYGGGLWHTWFDRDLGIAGRAILKGSDGGIETRNFAIRRPIARIPNLAIHLTAGSEREHFSPNLHEHGKAVLSMNPEFFSTKPTEEEKDVSGRIHPALLRMVAAELGVEPSSIEDLEMQLIDCQPSALGGATNEFIYSGRLDNLCSAYQSLRALIDSSVGELDSQVNVKVAMLFDHEEVGSASAQGAGSSIFMDTLTRIQEILGEKSSQALMRSLRNSFVVSADMAHGLHPNYASKHDSTMAPGINGGLVIKHNANQRYATTSLSATVFRRIGKLAGVPVQEFTVRSDSACGSTVGPIIATLSGILTVDVGTPQFSMHSIREMMGSDDALTGYLHLKAVLDHHPSFVNSLDSIKL